MGRLLYVIDLSPLVGGLMYFLVLVFLVAPIALAAVSRFFHVDLVSLIGDRVIDLILSFFPR